MHSAPFLPVSQVCHMCHCSHAFTPCPFSLHTPAWTHKVPPFPDLPVLTHMQVPLTLFPASVNSHAHTPPPLSLASLHSHTCVYSVPSWPTCTCRYVLTLCPYPHLPLLIYREYPMSCFPSLSELMSKPNTPSPIHMQPVLHVAWHFYRNLWYFSTWKPLLHPVYLGTISCFENHPLLNLFRNLQSGIFPYAVVSCSASVIHVHSYLHTNLLSTVYVHKCTCQTSTNERVFFNFSM